MVYTISKNRNDREYNKFLGVQTGSLSSVTVSVVGGSVATYEAAVTPFQNYATSITATDTDVWPATAGSVLVITDVLCSTGSATLVPQTISLASAGSTEMSVYLANQGGFVSNLQTPIKTIAGGSLVMTTSSAGSTAITVGGYLE